MTSVDAELERGYRTIQGVCLEGTYYRTTDGCFGQIAVPAPAPTAAPRTPTASPGPAPSAPPRSPSGAAPSSTPSAPVSTVLMPQASDAPRPTSCPITVTGWQVTIGDLVNTSSVPALGTAYASFAAAKSRYQSGGADIAFDLALARSAIQQDAAFPPCRAATIPTSATRPEAVTPPGARSP